MINSIKFSGYKSFKNDTELNLKPLTIVFGKNSSGKSAVVKLPTLLEQSLSGKADFPLSHINKNVELGAEHRDLFYDREIQGTIEFQILKDDKKISVNITSAANKPVLTSWSTSLPDMPDITIDTLKNFNFKGFFPTIYMDELKSIFSLMVDYIGPFRLPPPRVFYLKGYTDIHKVGNLGESAYERLALDEDLLNQVNEWYKKSFDGWELKLKSNAPYYELLLSQGDMAGINICDVGQGMSQVLPIVVQSFINKDVDKLNILEQPELHLHPAAHGDLAELLALNLIDSKNKYLIETHSKNFILRLRRLIAEKKISKELIKLYYVEFDSDSLSSGLRPITIKDNGEVDYWPENVFEESFEEIKALMNAQKYEQ